MKCCKMHCLPKYLFISYQYKKSEAPYISLQGPVAQWVASPTADPGVASSIMARANTFMEK